MATTVYTTVNRVRTWFKLTVSDSFVCENSCVGKNF